MKDHQFSLTIDPNNAAFKDMDTEIARILRDAADRIERRGMKESKLFDRNGISVGSFELKELPTFPQAVPNCERHFTWMERVEMEDGVRFLPPHRDPHQYEQAYDLLFDTPEQAQTVLNEDIESENIEPEEAAEWYLCEQTLRPVEMFRPQAAEADTE